MSAWFVSKRHIDIIVTAAGRDIGSIAPNNDPTEAGKRLWIENMHSIHACYPDTRHKHEMEDQIAAYEYTETLVSPGQLAMALSSYDYQTCEHEAWAPGNAVYDLIRDLAFGLMHDVEGARGAEWAP